MDDNQKKFNMYVFLSTFARSLIEIFIPLILFKYGYTFKEVVIYHLIMYVFSIIFTYPCILLSKKYNNKILAIIGIVSFILLQIVLNKIVHSYYYLIILAILYALYRRAYWISRRYYNLKVMHKENIAKSYSIISIINQLGVIISSYIGSLLLDFISLNVLTIVAMILFFFSTLFLYKLKFKSESNDIKLEPLKILKEIPKRDLYLFGSYETTNIIKFLFPLYIFMYVKDTYKTVGLLYLLTNLANIVFIYFYGRKINDKKNYLRASILLVVIIYILKANVTTSILLVISFIEGIFNKMYELSISKEFYKLSKKFEYFNYNLVYELTQNIFRAIVMSIIVFFTFNVKVMIYIVLFFIAIGALLNFKTVNKNLFEERV